MLALHGAKRKALFAQIEQSDLVLTTYALLPRDLKQLHGRHWHLLILDEAQNIETRAAAQPRPPASSWPTSACA